METSKAMEAEFSDENGVRRIVRHIGKSLNALSRFERKHIMSRTSAFLSC